LIKITLIPIPGYGIESNGGLGFVKDIPMTGDILLFLNMKGYEIAGSSQEQSVWYLLHDVLHENDFIEFTASSHFGGTMGRNSKYNPGYEAYINGIVDGIGRSLGFNISGNVPQQPGYGAVRVTPLRSDGTTLTNFEKDSLSIELQNAINSPTCGNSDANTIT
jgi:hypothetical protein